MRPWIIWSTGIAIVCQGLVSAQTNSTSSSATKKGKDQPDGKSYYALEKLVLEPEDIGLDAKRTIDGMVINVKSPVKVIANNNEQSYLVTSTEFHDKNLKFAAMGMHSWMSLTYKITEEKDKRVTLTVMEFHDAKSASRFWTGGSRSEKDEEGTTQDQELKGSLFYRLLHGPILLNIDWDEPKTPGVDHIISSYKAKLMTF